MLQNQQVVSNITTNDQTVHFMPAGIALHFQALNKLKMGTSLCFVTVTLKCQEKNANIFFLNKDIFFYQKSMLDTFIKNAHGITERPTL